MARPLRGTPGLEGTLWVPNPADAKHAPVQYYLEAHRAWETIKAGQLVRILPRERVVVVRRSGPMGQAVTRARKGQWVYVQLSGPARVPFMT